MTSHGRVVTIDTVVRLINFEPPMDHWWLLVASTHDGAVRVAERVHLAAGRASMPLLMRLHDPPDGAVFLKNLGEHPGHAMIVTMCAGPTLAFWRALDGMRPRLQRAAPTVIVVAASAERELRVGASHLSSWFTGLCLYVHDESLAVDHALQAIRDRCCSLFNSIAHLRRACFDANIDWSRVERVGYPNRDLWHEALVEARRHRRIRRLVDVVLEDYPAHPDADELRRLADGLDATP